MAMPTVACADSGAPASNWLQTAARIQAIIAASRWPAKVPYRMKYAVASCWWRGSVPSASAMRARVVAATSAGAH